MTTQQNSRGNSLKLLAGMTMVWLAFAITHFVVTNSVLEASVGTFAVIGGNVALSLRFRNKILTVRWHPWLSLVGVVAGYAVSFIMFPNDSATTPLRIIAFMMFSHFVFGSSEKYRTAKDIGV